MAVGRQNFEQQTNFIRAAVNWNDTNVANGNVIGTLPKGAMLVRISVLVKTAFNAATTNNLLLGTTAAGNDIATTSDSGAGSTGFKAVTTGLALSLPTGDRLVYATYTQTGTAATAGAAEIVLEYIPDLMQYA